jgi:hypothetical protein
MSWRNALQGECQARKIAHRTVMASCKILQLNDLGESAVRVRLAARCLRESKNQAKCKVSIAQCNTDSGPSEEKIDR